MAKTRNEIICEEVDRAIKSHLEVVEKKHDADIATVKGEHSKTVKLLKTIIFALLALVLSGSFTIVWIVAKDNARIDSLIISLDSHNTTQTDLIEKLTDVTVENAKDIRTLTTENNEQDKRMDIYHP